MLERNEWVAVIWLASLAVGGVIYVVRRFQDSHYGIYESILYAPTYLLGRLLWRVQFKNEPPSEIDAGALLVANHRSSVDPFFVQLAARRRVHWMVAKEYCDHVIFGPILSVFQVIPTNRSGMDTAATKHAVRLTRMGRLVGMFPEGRLNHSKEPLLSIRSGAAMIAARSCVPIIPLFIQGSPYRKTVWSPLFIPARVVITFGQPIHPPAEEPAAELKHEVQHESNHDLTTSDTATALHPAGLGAEPEEPGLAASDQLILEWGQQIVSLAGYADFPVQLASKRKRRQKPPKQQR